MVDRAPLPVSAPPQDPDAQGNVVAIHVHKGGPNENGPIVVNVCASASPFSSMTNAVEKPDGGRFACVRRPSARLFYRLLLVAFTLYHACRAWVVSPRSPF